MPVATPVASFSTEYPTVGCGGAMVSYQLPALQYRRLVSGSNKSPYVSCPPLSFGHKAVVLL